MVKKNTVGTSSATACTLYSGYQVSDVHTTRDLELAAVKRSGPLSHVTTAEKAHHEELFEALLRYTRL